MKIITFIKKNWLIIILALIAVILIFIKINSQKSSTNQGSSFSTYQQTPTPTNQSIYSNSPNKPTPTLGVDEIVDLNYDFPLERLLPYQGQNFRVDRYQGVNLLRVVVKDKNNLEAAKKEVQDWLVENGVEQDDKYVIVFQ